MKTKLTETNVSVTRATKESLRVRYAELLQLRELSVEAGLLVGG